MSWKTVRLPILSALVVMLLPVLFFSFNDKIDPKTLGDNIIKTPEATFPPVYTPTPIAKITNNKILATKTPTGTNSVTAQNNQSSSNTSNQNQDVSSAVNTTVTSSVLSTATSSPVPTYQPTSAPVAEVNIQIWVRGWQYVNNQQYTADGSVKIKKDGQEIASGSVNGDIIYKASNMPANSNLSIFFYLPNGCGQVKQITTSNNSSLHNIDFNFSSNTACI